MSAPFAHGRRAMDKVELQAREEKRTDRLVVDRNEFMLLPDGPQRLDVLLALIAAAQHRLDLFFYIFSADAAGHRVVQALSDACRRGVRVTVLLDAFGSALTGDALFAPLIAQGARFGRFGRRRTTRYLIRNHQKMVVVDGRAALIGGFNISNSYFAVAQNQTAWRDMAVRIDGPLVAQLEGWFDALAAWTLSPKQSFRALRRMVRNWQPGEGKAVWLMGGPTRHLNGWTRRLKHDLQEGQRLDLAEAYFSPGWGMMRRLCAIARRGSALVVLPLHTDTPVTVGAARYFYSRMLRSGVNVREYRAQMLHSKLLVVDDIAYVGSANFDMRSLFINVELMLRVNDPAFAAAVRSEIADLAAKSRVIDEPRFSRMARPLRRLRWWFDHLLVGVLDYTVTRRLNFRGLRRD